MTSEPKDWRSRALRSVGLSSAKEREATAAQDQKHQAKAQEQQARQARDDTREARNQAVAAFDLAKGEFLDQFPPQFPSPKPAQPWAPTSGIRTAMPTPALTAPAPVSPPRRPSPRP